MAFKRVIIWRVGPLSWLLERRASASQMKTQTLASTAFSLIIFAIVFASVITDYLDYRNETRIELAVLHSVMKEKIVSITISSASSCKQPFEFPLQSADTNVFLQASKVADAVGFTGHSNSVLEASIAVKTPTRVVNYIATVNQQQSQDLFLNRVLPSHDPDGRIREQRYREIRLPGMGKWMKQIAPNAAL